MKTVANKLWTNSYTIKKSKFEVFILQVTNIFGVEKFLQTYIDNKATHNCYAYIIGFKKIIKKFFDDSEPSRLAGFAILKILEEKQLTNIIVLVRRYFQPPKLGVGRLMRAYQYSLLKYLEETRLLSIIPSKKYYLIVPINLVNLVYQWQKQNHFMILEQKNDDLKMIFIVNVADKKHPFAYHNNVSITFIEDSFLISDN
ncbi:MAG: YigZ family protein [Spiroplasma sp.]